MRSIRDTVNACAPLSCYLVWRFVFDDYSSTGLCDLFLLRERSRTNSSTRSGHSHQRPDDAPKTVLQSLVQSTASSASNKAYRSAVYSEPDSLVTELFNCLIAGASIPNPVAKKFLIPLQEM